MTPPTKITLASIILFICLSVPLVSPQKTHASFSQAYNDYTFEFDRYRNAHQEYQVAKSKYLTFKTLTSQNEAIEKTRNVLAARTQTVSTYLKALKERLDEAQGNRFPEYESVKSKTELSLLWLENHKSKVLAASSLSDLTYLANDFTVYYRGVNKLTWQTKGLIILARFSFLLEKLDTQSVATLNFLKVIEKEGGNTLPFERQLAAIGGKRKLAQDKFNQLKGIFFSEEDQSWQEERTTLLIQEARLYLEESASFLQETIANMKEE